MEEGAGLQAPPLLLCRNQIAPAEFTGRSGCLG
jgi:hypothetical protein